MLQFCKEVSDVQDCIVNIVDTKVVTHLLLREGEKDPVDLLLNDGFQHQL